MPTFGTKFLLEWLPHDEERERGACEHDHDVYVKSSDPEHPANLIPELCKQMWNLGWVTGTGGGMTIKKDENIYIAPSDLFVLTPDRAILRSPPPQKVGKCPNAPLSSSTPTISVTLVFEITHQEMIKGIRVGSTKESLRFYDTLQVPIIENTAEEEDLQERMAEAMKKYPNTNAVLVRRHGVYVWGENWQKAKSMTECYDYLFEIAVKMKAIGVDPAKIPEDSEYCEVATKKRKLLHK
ncbi:class II aldolase/adducin N-terminal [Chytridium lagenaria]|nr:class II aldolase/adducin N-terminal [Chytridium lagenaria]